jgi:integrase
MRVTVRAKRLNSGEQSLYLDIYHSGKRRYEFLNLYLSKDRNQNKETKALAEKIRAKREIEFANNEFGFVADFKRKVSLIEYFQKIADTQKKNSPHHSTLKHVKDFAKGKVYFQEIDEKWVEKFQAYLLSKSISQNSARTYYSILRRIFRQAVKDKIIPRNPAEFVSPIKSQDIQRNYLSIDEIKVLAKTDYNFSFPDIKRAFLFSCFTGLRFSDIKQLKWKDIKGDHIEKKQQKTQDFVYIPLSRTAKELIALSQSNVIPLPDTNVFTLPVRCFTNHNLKKWFKVAKIDKNAHFHLSRHTFAVMNITQGAQLYTVSKLLGHKNLKTTEIYSKLIDEKKKEAIDNLPVIEVSIS